MSAPSAYPLTWPVGRARKAPHARKVGKFRKDGKWLTVASATDRLEAELDRLGARYPVLSSNVELTLSGRPRSGASAPTDPGVCAYFQMDGKPYALACDTYAHVEDNIAAIAAHIEATRAITRHGVASAAETLRAFESLPAPPTAWEVLGVSPGASKPEIEAAFRKASKEAHPDRPGGSHDRMAALSDARNRALATIQ